MKRHHSDSYVDLIAHRGKNTFDPRKRDDLVINRNRIKDVEDWIDRAISSPKVSLLLLCGPPGCGKTTTVRVLAFEKGIEIVDWTTPADTYEFSDNSEFLKPVSVTSKFKAFLLGVGRYSCVVHERSASSYLKKIIVVKDFPTNFLSSPDQFTDIIDFYVEHGRTPVIFICSESAKKKSTDIAYELFREDFKVKHNITQICFICIPVTSVIKALKRVVQVLRSAVNDDVLRDIAVESNGDVRKAINSLHILSINGSKPYKRVVSGSKKLSRNENKKSNYIKDDKEATSLFHAVGRVLYAKRDVPVSNNKIVSNPRGDFTHKPLDIAKEFSHYSNPFISLAHSNYLDIFSSINYIMKAADYLSVSDIIMSEWREKELLSTVGFNVAVCGLMESNVDPIKKWKPLKGSQWNDDLKLAVTNRVSIENILSDYCVSKSDIILDTVPYMTQMWRSRNEQNCTKWCKAGLLPHRTEDLLCVMRRIKTDILLSTKILPEGNKSGSDSSFCISDDSD